MAMSTGRRPASRALPALGIVVALSGCEVDPGCSTHMELSVIVEVTERATGMPAARGATGLSEHESGVLTDFYSYRGEELRLVGNWESELPGAHTVLVRKPGFLTETAHADVHADRCHVEPRTVQVSLARDPRAVPESPVSFIEGPDSAGWERPASAEVQVHGDTLEIKGYTGSDCTELRVVAFRSRNSLHVQIEPSDTPLDSCIRSRWFEARFTLPPEPTRLLVTNGHWVPVEFFDGEVRPVEEDLHRVQYPPPAVRQRPHLLR